MSKFKKKKSDGQPAISTASLPDIVFMLLFFFMVTIKSLQGTFGTEPRIQLNDAFATKRDIIQFIEIERENTDEAERPLMTFSMKVDNDVKMGIVTDVKQELRKANALKINYSTGKTDKIVD